MAISYWCLPCAGDAKPFAEVIAALATEQGAPTFQPHLSLGTLDEIAPDPGVVVQALRGLVLEPTEIDATDVFTKSLFVRFALSDSIARARAQFETLPGFVQRRTFDPHISLCYGLPPRQLAPDAAQALLAAPVRFDRLAAVKITLPVATYDDIRAWQVAAIYEL